MESQPSFYRGRLTLIKSVLGTLGIYYLSIFKVPDVVLKLLEKKHAIFFWGGTHDSRKLAWVKWLNVLASHDKGGLGIGSLRSFNLALLQKWRWRFISNANALWVKVIKAFHGQEGGFDLNVSPSSGIWSKIVGSSNFLHSNEILPNDSIRFRVGSGCSIRFWKDLWTGNSPLYLRYNRLFRLDRDKDCLLSSDRDVCYWSMANDGMFSVTSTRHIIDSHLLPALDMPTQWDKCIPRNVNIFMWRFMLDRLPHRLNLSSRGIDIPSIGCPLCNANVESSNHVFFDCDNAKAVWSSVRNWCDLSFPACASFDQWKLWFDSWQVSKEKKMRLFVIFAATLWWLWRFRNIIIFVIILSREVTSTIIFVLFPSLGFITEVVWFTVGPIGSSLLCWLQVMLRDDGLTSPMFACSWWFFYLNGMVQANREANGYKQLCTSESSQLLEWSWSHSESGSLEQSSPRGPVVKECPTSQRLILGGDLNGHIGARRRDTQVPWMLHGYGVRNEEGRAILDFATAHDLGIVNLHFKKRDHHLITFQSWGCCTKIDYLLVRRGDLKVCKYCRVPSKRKQALPTHLLALDNLFKKCSTQKIGEVLNLRIFVEKPQGGRKRGFSESIVGEGIIKDAAKDTLGVAIGTSKTHTARRESWWLCEEVQSIVAVKQARFRELLSCREGNEDERLGRLKDSKEGANDIFRIAKARERRRDLGDICFIKDEEGRTITDEEEIKKRWEEYFSSLFNAREPEGHEEGVGPNRQPHTECYYSRISQAEVRTALQKMGRNKAVGPDQIPIEAWKSLGDEGSFWLTILFNKIFTSARMPEEWRLSEVIPIFKNKDDAQVCSKYRGIKLLGHTMKL
ncbi:RNA-directed DNA polymerase, eukaryota, reverse transcriptase zinc-binding domain protein [Tanacetum coccineum]